MKIWIPLKMENIRVLPVDQRKLPVRRAVKAGSAGDIAIGMAGGKNKLFIMGDTAKMTG